VGSRMRVCLLGTGGAANEDEPNWEPHRVRLMLARLNRLIRG